MYHLTCFFLEGPCCHPRSREISKLATCIITVVYRFTLLGFSHMIFNISFFLPKSEHMFYYITTAIMLLIGYLW